LQFRDRVVQWAIYRQVNPLLDKQFIEDSFACRAGKGTHKAIDRLQYWLRKIDRTGKRWYYKAAEFVKAHVVVRRAVALVLIKRDSQFAV